MSEKKLEKQERTQTSETIPTEVNKSQVDSNAPKSGSKQYMEQCK